MKNTLLAIDDVSLPLRKNACLFPDRTEPAIAQYGWAPSIACAVSADGRKWMVTAMPFVKQFVEHCSFLRHNGQYSVHSQLFPGNDWSAAYAATKGEAAPRLHVIYLGRA